MSLSDDKIKITVESEDVTMTFEVRFDANVEYFYSVFRTILQGLRFHSDTINEIMPIDP